jgi:hypothetical protein
MENLMAAQKYEYQSDFVKTHRAEARAEGRAATLLTVLDARGLPISEAQRTRILGCKDADDLERWVRKAVVASAADDIFV